MIELKNLSAGYGGKTVVKDVSLCFPAGQVTVLLASRRYAELPDYLRQQY